MSDPDVNPPPADTPPPVPVSDPDLDDVYYGEDEPEEEDDGYADCGRWVNGKLSPYCSLAGSEWCDWECPIGCARRDA